MPVWRHRRRSARYHRVSPIQPPTIVAIETTAEHGSVALLYAGSMRQQNLPLVHRNAERALESIRDLLQAHRLELARVDAIAFASGPGAFTGLRVGCALAQGLAFGCDRPVIPVSSLRALALRAGALPGARVLAATDARMGQVYWAVFEASATMRTLSPAALADPAQLEDIVRRWHPGVIAGDGLKFFDVQAMMLADPIRCPQARADAAAVAELGACDWAEGRVLQARDAAPDYVRDRVALTVAQRRSAAVESGA